jgi:hypothetical protein
MTHFNKIFLKKLLNYFIKISLKKKSITIFSYIKTFLNEALRGEPNRNIILIEFYTNKSYFFLLRY